MQYDVVVVGAGLSGLVAAYHIQAAGKTVLVLEASNEVGGRIKTHNSDDNHIELGAAFIGKRHVRMKKLVSKFGLHLKSASEGVVLPVMWWKENGLINRFFPSLTPSDMMKTVLIFRTLSRLSKSIPSKQPWCSSIATNTDCVSFGSWLDQQGASRNVYHFFHSIIGGFAACSLDKISLLHVLWWIARSGGVLRAFQDGSNLVIAEGAQELPSRIERALHPNVVLNALVKTMIQKTGFVEITYGEKNKVYARYALVTAPIPTLKNIHFDPPLPEKVQEMVNHLNASDAYKVGILLDENLKPANKLAIGFNDIPLAWKTGKVVAGIGFASESDSHVINNLRLALQIKSGQHSWVKVKRWKQDPFIRGAYIIFQPNQLTRYGSLLNQRHKSIFFAGAERSTWVNNMEGAVESGETVAHQIIHDLDDF